MAITFDVGQVRRFRDDGRRLVFSHSFQVQALNDAGALVFGDCCHEGPGRISNYHKHTLVELCETDLVEPIPEPAQKLCAFKDCDELPSHNVHLCTRYCVDNCPRNSLRCHDFVPPQATAAKDIPPKHASGVTAPTPPAVAVSAAIEARAHCIYATEPMWRVYRDVDVLLLLLAAKP